MRAIALRRGATEAELVDVPEPTLHEGEVMVQAVRTGVCGTDRELIERQKVDAPPGADFLILGHEGLGRVVDVRGEVGGFKRGDLVVPVVRRGCGDCNACLTGHADYCYTGRYTERGIHKQHGFFSEFYADRPEYLVVAPPEIEDVAVLGEPMSVSVKAVGIALDFQRRVRFNGAYSRPQAKERVLVAGHGPIGMLGLLLFLETGFDVWVLGRRPTGDPQVEMIESVGARYARSDDVQEEVKRNGGFFAILEATGLSEVTFQLANYLGRNGVLLLTGVPRGPKSMQIDGNTLMASLVRFNQGIIGSVNACAGCFESALASLGQFRREHPDFMERIFTSRYTLADWREAFTGKGHNDIKVTVEFQA
jgi:threonine dehydrogenase-like Zn-dependent dehydrogenase